MRDAASQTTDGFHFAGLAQTFFEVFAPRDVEKYETAAGIVAVFGHRLHGEAAPEGFAVLPGEAQLLVPDLLALLDLFEQLGGGEAILFAGTPNVEDLTTEQLDFGAVEDPCRFWVGQLDDAFTVRDEVTERGLVEKATVLPFAAPQRRFDLVVTGDLMGKSHHFTRMDGVGQEGKLEIRVAHLQLAATGSSFAGGGHGLGQGGRLAAEIGLTRLAKAESLRTPPAGFDQHATGVDPENRQREFA